MNEKLSRAIQGYRHKHYDRTKELAKFCNQVVTGGKYGDLIVNYAPRETDEQKEQRVDISQVRTKAIAGTVEGFFKKAFRVDKLKILIEHASDDERKKVTQHSDNYGEDGQSLMVWAEETALYYNNVDPNAFYWVKHEFIDNEDIFDPVFFEAASSLDYSIKKGNVSYFVGMANDKLSYQSDSGLVDTVVENYYYIDGEVIQQAIYYDADIAKETNYYKEILESGFRLQNVVIDGYEYLLLEFKNETGICPVCRVGYNYDKQTKKQTYVPFWDNASDEYKIQIQNGSAFDIALRLHTFPKLIMMYTPCNYRDAASGSICRDGHLHPSGEFCPSCKGTGKKYHTTGQDVIEIQLPTEDQPHVIKPSDIIHYADAPFDIVNKLQELTDSAASKISQAIFSIDISYQHSGNTTAEEVRTYRGTAQDALQEFTKSPRKLFLFTLDIIAAHKGVNDLKKELLYPNDFDLETEDELLSKLNRAKEANASPEIIESITTRLVNKQNRADSDYIKVYSAMRKFEPFSNIPQDIKRQLILELPDNSLQKAKYVNFKLISEEIVATDPTWILKSYKEQEKAVNDLARVYADQAAADNSANRMASFLPDDFSDEEE